MVVRDLFDKSDDNKVIVRAIFEDRCKPQDIHDWINKYDALLMKLKSAKLRGNIYLELRKLRRK